MKKKLTTATLERLIDDADQLIARFPHGNHVLSADGTSRPMTVRDQFSVFLTELRRRNPAEPFSFDLDPFLDYWRDCILALDPPGLRPISPERLKKKGGHAVLIPSLWGVLERPAACHFEFKAVVGTPDLCDLHVQRVRQGYSRKTILRKKHRFNPPPEMLICHGTPEQLRTFIYAQRGGKPQAPIVDLRQYVVEVVGHSPDWANEYAVLHDWAVDHEDPAGTLKGVP